MRQVGILAAAGDYALTHHIERLAEDHARARRLAEALAPFGIVDPDRVRSPTSSRWTSRSPQWTLPTLGRGGPRAGRAGLGPRLRGSAGLVTHLDVDDDDIDRAIEVLTTILGEPS